jgi:thiopeptide-type bacteriocin biosynthesis protein
MAFHVFRDEPVEPLLLDCVDPLQSRLKRQHAIRRFFFIRYSEQGYHVRARFAVAPEVNAAIVRSEIGGVLRTYLDACPESGARIVEAGYEPELLRYGGFRGVEIAEAHFDFSSAMALGILRRTGDRGPAAIAARVGLALEAMIALARGFGLSRAAMLELFRGYGQGTLDALKRRDLPSELAAAGAAQQPRLRDLARRAFEEGLRPGSWAAAWLDHGVQLSTQLADAGVTPASPELTLVSARLVSSYLHMFLNRLGLAGGPEAALCHLAQDVCSEENAPSPAGAAHAGL